jgi:hypothetical protein
MILESFHNGGWGMWPTLVVGLSMIGVSARYAVSPEKRFVPLIVASSTLTLLSGALGFVTGLIAATTTSFSAIEARPTLAVAGFGESLNNVGLAITLLAVGMIAVTVGAARIARAPVAS